MKYRDETERKRKHSENKGKKTKENSKTCKSVLLKKVRADATTI